MKPTSCPLALLRAKDCKIGGGSAFAVFDGAELPTAGEHQHVNHLALPVDTLEEFDAAYQRLKDHGVAVTEIIERGYGKTFYFHDPNGIRLQIVTWSRKAPAFDDAQEYLDAFEPIHPPLSGEEN